MNTPSYLIFIDIVSNTVSSHYFNEQHETDGYKYNLSSLIVTRRSPWTGCSCSISSQTFVSRTQTFSCTQIFRLNNFLEIRCDSWKTFPWNTVCTSTNDSYYLHEYDKAHRLYVNLIKQLRLIDANRKKTSVTMRVQRKQFSVHADCYHQCSV